MLMLSLRPCARSLHALRIDLLGALSFAVFVSLFAAAPASAVVHQFTITGSVDFLNVPFPYSLNDDEPASGGETFTLTFDFDDQAPFSSGNGSTVSSYDPAISNISFSLSTGDTLNANTEGVLAAINSGFNHQWSFSAPTGTPGFSTTLPEVLSAFNEDTFEDEDFFLQSFNLVLLDDTQTAYAMAPPELVLPSSASFGTEFLSVEWFGAGPEPITLELSVSTLSSTPVGTPVPLAGGPALLAMAIGLGGLGAWRAGMKHEEP